MKYNVHEIDCYNDMMRASIMNINLYTVVVFKNNFA